MVAVLITGMSGAGKSTALAGLARLGHETVDTDDAAWLTVVDGEPLWREPLVHALLDRPRRGPLFVLGTVANQGRFAPRFAAVVLLTAPPAVLLERVRTRVGNDFGKEPGERARIAADIRDVEPRLRAGATHVIDTTRRPDEVVRLLLGIAERARQSGLRISSSLDDGSSG